jgi:hypothetical protein
MSKPEVFSIAFTAQGVDAVHSLIGKEPTSTGLWPLWTDIERQVKEQIAAAEAAAQAPPPEAKLELGDAE